jgi:hypothetical protein
MAIQHFVAASSFAWAIVDTIAPTWLFLWRLGTAGRTRGDGRIPAQRRKPLQSPNHISIPQSLQGET